MILFNYNSHWRWTSDQNTYLCSDCFTYYRRTMEWVYQTHEWNKSSILHYAHTTDLLIIWILEETYFMHWREQTCRWVRSHFTIILQSMLLILHILFVFTSTQILCLPNVEEEENSISHGEKELHADYSSYFVNALCIYNVNDPPTSHLNS